MKRKYLRINHKNREQRHRRVGVIGTHEGVGATHTSVLLGTYLSDERNLRTAVLEMNQKDEFRFLEEVNAISKHSTEDYFSLFDTSYFRNVKEHGLNLLLNLDYDYFIMDYGSFHSKTMNHLNHWDHLVVVCSLMDWKKDKLVQFIRTNQNMIENVRTEVLAVFAHPTDCRKIQKELNIIVHPLCYEPDPFHLSRKTKSLFRKLFV